MHRHTLKFFLCLILATMNSWSMAQERHMTEVGNWQVHHIAFPSTFIQPETAKAIGMDRRNNYNLINISVLDKKTLKPQKVRVSGYAQNLIGHRKELTFKEVDEGNAVYYLAQIRHTNEETFRFYIQLTNPKSGERAQIEFMQKMWVD